MERTYKAIALLAVVSTVIGIVGIHLGAPQAEEAVLNNLIEQNSSSGFILPMSELLAGYYWGGVSILIGLFLAYGFFWNLPWWPEKGLMIPAVGFIVLNFGFSLYMLYAILYEITAPSDLIPVIRAGTIPMYGIVVASAVVGGIAHYVRDNVGDEVW